MRRTVALLALLTLLAACGDEGPSGTTFESARALADELGCTDFEVSDPENQIDLGIDVESDGAACQFDGERVTIDVYESREHADQAFNVAESIGCAFAQGFGIERFVAARGDNWAVAPDDNLDDEAAESIADALGGVVIEVDCT